MPQIFDNMAAPLLAALQQTLALAYRADFCVGYFNLRGWRHLDGLIADWPGGPERCCRLLVGMQQAPQQELREALRLAAGSTELDLALAVRLKRRMAEEFREQLTLGTTSNADEEGLRRLSAQLHAGKVVVKLFLHHPLHAKLYLLHRHDPINPAIGYLGSSNLTFAGLAGQGELNVDVLDRDACAKLQRWFDDRWGDQWCLDISQELADIIDESWARDTPLPPYFIYLKMAYHLSREAREGLSEFAIPREFGNELFEFQKAAVKIAAHHLNTRGGVLIGDVVGLGKTLMATALAKLFEQDQGTETLIICPKNLVPMWQDHLDRYRLYARVLSLSRVASVLPQLIRYRVVLIDESHNLRNPEGQRYRAIKAYIEKNESRCILLSATPYNKSYLDLSAQLRLFVPEQADLGIRPEQLLRDVGEVEFQARYQCPVRTLAAFEKSTYADDWRELMRRYMVRRTRSFIQQNYASTDPANGRTYLPFANGSRAYFPTRVPKTVGFPIDAADPADQYARLYSEPIVGAINGLHLPRYGLGNYLAARPSMPPAPAEAAVLAGLSRAGKRLMGFCRTNLFKRLESGGPAFLQSVERHLLRNAVFLHAIEHGLKLPIGSQDAAMLDPAEQDSDAELPFEAEEEPPAADDLAGSSTSSALRSAESFRQRAAAVYAGYQRQQRRFKWLSPSLFTASLRRDLETDNAALLDVLQRCGDWDVARDAKLTALCSMLAALPAQQKVLIFSQFADTVAYLVEQLQRRGFQRLAGVTGDADNPTLLAWRFSPRSNGKRAGISPEQELRILVVTDVLSEGQNLQDCAFVVNYDLPWAIVRLIQRAGRVDRIGQQAEQIVCATFLPADGVERVISLRTRLRQRLRQNSEVVGADEAFFEDELQTQPLLDLYHEKAGILDGDAEGEVDRASFAYQIWKNAIDADPGLEKKIAALPNVVYSSRAHAAAPGSPEGVLLYLRTADDNDALAWIDRQGRSVTESQLAILQAAACHPQTPAQPRQPQHHELVTRGVELLVQEEQHTGGQLGRPSGARFRTYQRLMRYAQQSRGTLFARPELQRALDDILGAPLLPAATDTLNRQLRSGIGDRELADVVIALREDGRLCQQEEERASREPRIISSLGLFATGED